MEIEGVCGVRKHPHFLALPPMCEILDEADIIAMICCIYCVTVCLYCRLNILLVIMPLVNLINFQDDHGLMTSPFMPPVSYIIESLKYKCILILNVVSCAIAIS